MRKFFMYNGTLIKDLMAAVARAEQKAQQQQRELQKELHEIFAMQIPITNSDRTYMGAA